MHRTTTTCLILTFVFCGLISISAEPTIDVSPKRVSLSGYMERAQLLVSANGEQPGQSSEDLTRTAIFSSDDPSVAEVDELGRIVARKNGQTHVTVVVDGNRTTVPISVSDVAEHAIQFHRDVRPILSKAGCAAGACHAAQHGKGGFKLSVFGFDPAADYDAITKSSRGRRITLGSPEQSLLLRKPTMREAHVGGGRIDPTSIEYEVIRQWIEGGTPFESEPAFVDSIQVFPSNRVGTLGTEQQLRVVASYSDDSQRDVTALAVFDVIDEGVASVDDAGLVTAIDRGQTGVMVRFEGQAAVSMLVIPYREQVDLQDWREINFIDEHAANKFRDLGLQPSPLCDDATFVRRAFLDCIGSLPSPEIVLAFLDSKSANKRIQLVDRLLGLTGDSSLDTFNDQYAAYWTLKWSDLIRNNSTSLGEQGMWALHNWIKDSFRENKPYDQFVSEVITAKGSIYSNGPANFFRVNTNSSALTEATSQLFLGVRLECAKCHHHPFEGYSQEDYYSMAAFFSRIGSKNSEEFGLFGRETVVTVRSSGEVSHPRTRQRMKPTPLGGSAVDHALDRRLPLADWLTSPDNELFARSVVNRYTRYLLGSGLVEPVDDLRSTNPPSNEPLLDALAMDFVDHGFDLKHLVRTIMTSRLYGLSSQPTQQNASDTRFYSHFNVKRISAEPLLDAVDHATGVRTKFPNLPIGTLAIELPDAEYANYFLTTFAKPRRVSVCECERAPDANLAQALHTLNGDTLAGKIAAKDGLLMKLVSQKLEHRETVNQLYLASLGRLPTNDESVLSRQILDEAQDATECYQDLLWALINSKQFLFVR